MIAIFEDDITLNTDPPNAKRALTRIKKFLKYKRNWEVFHLGCFPDNRNDSQETLFQNIYKVKAYGAHAYILNKTGIQRIASLIWEGRDYDGYLMDIQQYAYLPRLFCQKAVKSDIPRGINIINNFPVLKKAGLDINEFYTTHIGVSFRVIVLLCLLIGCVFKRVV